MKSVRQTAASAARQPAGRGSAPSARPLKRNGRFRRSEVARFRGGDDSLPAQAARSAAGWWERLAIPTGMLVFWAWFVAANWPRFTQLLG